MVDLSVPDKLSVATYLISYYSYFKEMQPGQPQKKTKMAVDRGSEAVPTRLTQQEQVHKVPHRVLQPTQPIATVPGKFEKPAPTLLIPPVKPVGTWRLGDGVSTGTDTIQTEQVVSKTASDSSTKPTPTSKAPLVVTESVPQLGGGRGEGGAIGRRSKFTTPQPNTEKPVAMETEEGSKPAQPPLKVDHKVLFFVSLLVAFFILANLLYLYA